MTLDPNRPESWEATQDLERIARSIPAIPNDFAELRELLSRITNPVAPSLRSAREGALPTGFGEDSLTLASKDQVGSQSGSLIGISPQVFYGQANLLIDPTWENVADQFTALTTVVAGAAFGLSWSGHYAVVSGTAPTTAPRVNRLYQRGETPGDNPFGSAALMIDCIFGTNAGVADVFIYPTSYYAPSTVPLLAYLVAGLKLKRETIHASTTITVRMQIMNQTQTTVLAESGPLDYQSISVNNEVRQLWTALAAPTTAPYWWRLKITLDHTAGSTSNPTIIVGEPLLQFAATEQLPPYGPILGQWQPQELINYGWNTAGGDANTIIASRAYAEGNDRYELMRSGQHKWGPGSAALDTTLKRTAVGELSTERLRLSATDDLGLGTTTHAFQIGPTSGVNLAMDGNEIEARNNGAAGGLHLNADGGGVTIGGNATPTTSADGMTFGTDVTLYRSAANELKTDDALVVALDHLLIGGRLAERSVVTPAQLTADQNDYNPTGLDAANVLRINTDATPRTITGLVAGTSGEELVIFNTAGVTLTLAHQSGSSAAANRFICPGAANYGILSGGAVRIWYDASTSRWRVIA